MIPSDTSHRASPDESATHAEHEHEANRLIREKSPYLLQHAYNPVDWYPWGEEAFEKAREEDKPIFLSIGYSTCHWCHVMERESFEDPEVAELMNRVFISIKVDREERPDIDHIYMLVCQMLTQQGGWPLTIIMTPDGEPFFAGTYFPKHSRFGRAGMMDLIPRIEELWTTQREQVLNSAEQITQAVQQVSDGESGEELDASALKRAYEQLAQRFDSQRGGFGSAPKFPTPHNYMLLLRYWRRSGEPEALSMVERSLQAMRRGGIYDHVGLGFHRYSTDARWLLPHFEKMLYDQALLAMAYTEAYQATGKEEYADTAREIFTYVLRDMTDPNGGFYSAEDADSEGEEGKFYVWTQDEIREALDPELADLVVRVYGVTEEGNFAEESTGQKTGTNILHRTQSLRDLAAGMELPEPTLLEKLEVARQRLFEVREERVHPHKDDKILTDWNGLMIAALAKAARAFGEPEYADVAEKAVAFLLGTMRDADGRLLHRYRDGEAKLQAHADDYAFLIWGLIELYEATFDASHLEMALHLNDEFLEHFWDEEDGGFFLTAEDGEELLVRPKETYDGAVPSANSVGMLNLLRLGRITAESAFEERASEISRLVSHHAQQAPSAHTQLLIAVDFGIGPSYEIVIAGEPRAEDTHAMLRALRTLFVPNKVVLLRPSSEAQRTIEIAPFIEEQTSLDGRATAYVCLNYACEMPTTDPEQMVALLTD